MADIADKKSRLIRSFGRIKSRKLSPNQNNIINKFYPKYELSDSNFATCFTKYSTINIEIGFGDGDFIFQMAQNNPEELFIGFEPYVNGMVNLLAKISSCNMSNILIYNGDFRQKFQLLQKYGTNYINKIYILFSDPWPKAKHHKRRLINSEFLDDYLALIIKSNHEIIMTTDDNSLKLWILWSIKQCKKFKWVAKEPNDWKIFPPDWHSTKYQQKAINENRTSIILTARYEL